MTIKLSGVTHGLTQGRRGLNHARTWCGIEWRKAAGFVEWPSKEGNVDCMACLATEVTT